MSTTKIPMTKSECQEFWELLVSCNDCSKTKKPTYPQCLKCPTMDKIIEGWKRN